MFDEVKLCFDLRILQSFHYRTDKRSSILSSPYGWSTIQTFFSTLRQYDLFFKTVPSLVLKSATVILFLSSTSSKTSLYLLNHHLLSNQWTSHSQNQVHMSTIVWIVLLSPFPPITDYFRFLGSLICRQIVTFVKMNSPSIAIGGCSCLHLQQFKQQRNGLKLYRLVFSSLIAVCNQESRKRKVSTIGFSLCSNVRNKTKNFMC